MMKVLKGYALCMLYFNCGGSKKIAKFVKLALDDAMVRYLNNKPNK